MEKSKGFQRVPQADIILPPADIFAGMYVPYDSEKIPFAHRWCGPKNYEHGVPVLVAVFPKYKGGDGQTVAVYCEAMPARFYTLKAEDGENSINTPLDGYVVSTGSGQAELAAKIAEAISEGMLCFRPLT